MEKLDHGHVPASQIWIWQRPLVLLQKIVPGSDVDAHCIAAQVPPNESTLPPLAVPLQDVLEVVRVMSVWQPASMTEMFAKPF